MANLTGAFDGSSDIKPLPPGEYMGKIFASERKFSKTRPENEYLNLTIDISDGVKKRRIWEILNIWNVNDTAATMAKQTFGEIKKAILGADAPDPKDSDELHEKHFGVVLAIEEAKNGYPAKNKVESYFKLTTTDIEKFKQNAQRHARELLSAERNSGGNAHPSPASAVAPAKSDAIFDDSAFDDDIPF